MSKIPDSTNEVFALFFVAVWAALAHTARLMYSRPGLSRRRVIGGIMISMVLVGLVYGLAVMRYQAVSGFGGIIIATLVGLFTDDVLARAKGLLDALSSKPSRSRDSDSGA